MQEASPAPRERPYNGISTQRAAIRPAWRSPPLRGRSCKPIASPQTPTARIYELRKEGHDIETRHVDRVNHDGSVNRVALYVLTVKDSRQHSLFPEVQ